MRRLRSALLSALLIGLPCGAPVAQPESAEQVSSGLEELTARTASAYDCRIALHGEPAYDDTSKTWLVNYEAAGEECDAAADELQREGLGLDVTFVRRPSLAQVQRIINRMIRNAEASSGCRIAVRGTPRLDEAGSQWLVSYVGSGVGCDNAAAVLRSEGRPLKIVFTGLHTNETFLR